MDEVHRLMLAGLARGVFPGAVLLVAIRDQVVFHRCYGLADLFSGRAMTRETIFDLASLTKPLATALAAMILAGKGKLDLDSPCSRVCKQLEGTDKADITPRHLLSHCSGLPAWRPYYMRLRYWPASARPAVLRRWLIKEPLADLPGLRSEYSDLGFMLLQWVLEEVGGGSLDSMVARQVYLPLGIESLFFNRVQKNAPGCRSAYAATEFCPWRSRLLIGQVHDDNAHVMGGVAGHAGLFGTAMGVCRLLQAVMFFDEGARSKKVFDPKLVESFFKIQTGSTWALGFDTPASCGSSAGKWFSTGSVGHLGYTGTSFWIDRQRGIIVVLLTNRVHPTRYNQGIKSFRPPLHDAVMKAIQNGQGLENEK